MDLPINNEDLLNIKHEVNTTLLPDVLKAINAIAQDPNDPYLSVDKLEIKKVTAALGAIGAVDTIEDYCKQEYINSYASASDLVYSDVNCLLNNQGIIIDTYNPTPYSRVDSLANFKLVSENNRIFLVEKNEDILPEVKGSNLVSSVGLLDDIVESTKDNQNYWSTQEIDNLATLNLENATSFVKKYMGYDVSDTERATSGSMNFSPVSITLNEWRQKLKGETDWAAFWEETGNNLKNLMDNALTTWLTSTSASVATKQNTIDKTISSTPYYADISAYANNGSKASVFRNKVIERLMASGPNFYSNLFDVYIIPTEETLNTVNQEASSNKMLSLLQKASQNNTVLGEILTPDSFNVRASNIEIPLPKLKTIQYKISQRVVKIPSNKESCEYTGTFEVDLDSQLFYHTLFSSLARNRPLLEENLIEAKGESTFFTVNKTSFKTFQSVISSKGIAVDMVVLLNSWGTTETPVKNASNVAIYLSNVRFLGYAGGFGYNNTPSKSRGKYPFIYTDLRIVKVN